MGNYSYTVSLLAVTIFTNRVVKAVINFNTVMSGLLSACLHNTRRNSSKKAA